MHMCIFALKMTTKIYIFKTVFLHVNLDTYTKTEKHIKSHSKEQTDNHLYKYRNVILMVLFD